MSLSSDSCQYRFGVACDLYAAADGESLATQASAGRYVRLGDRQGGFFAVTLCEDGYLGWLSQRDRPHLLPADRPYAPPLLDRPAIAPRLPAVIAFCQAAQEQPNHYLWGGTVGPHYDCSGLMQAAFASEGIWLPRDSYQQAAFCTPIPQEALEPGDLIFFAKTERVSHVAIYLGEGFYLHSSGRDRGRNGIGIDHLDPKFHPVSALYAQQFHSCGRVMTSYVPPLP